MDLSPPSLTRSPSTPPVSYCPISSPDLLEQQYKLQSVYPSADPSASCSLMDHDSALRASVEHDWSAAPVPSSLMAEYDSFSYDSVHSHSHSHSHIYSAASPAHSHSPAPALPSRLKEESAEPHYSSSSLDSSSLDHFSPPRAVSVAVAAAPYISDVYGPPQGYHMLDGAPHPHAAAPFYLPTPGSHLLTSAPVGLADSMLNRRIRLRTTRRAPRRLTTKEEANFQCQVKGCGKLFSRSYNYKAHMETHDEKREYPFPCTVADCTKKFVRKTDLQRHNQSVHMKERNHPCDFCGRKFARKDTLRRHMEDGCSKRFDIGSIDLHQADYDSLQQQHQQQQQQHHHHQDAHVHHHQTQQRMAGMSMTSSALPPLNMGVMAPAMVPRNHMHGWAP
ncbi:hypothetical protein TD95_004020 [Thielaviopsis punctulata]|uniref:C2H2-type domain-containing protein n=1 Tax=Thielaviopsis punctulata TaxID=72032 RepID=A0A0F4Z7L3_9PEZI|nr:hypothetical protein TD95_004020 [Thielaviopsis punctulata]